MQVLSISELVKGAVAEAETLGKQTGEGSPEEPVKVQLGRAAQASLQVMVFSYRVSSCTSSAFMQMQCRFCLAANLCQRVHCKYIEQLHIGNASMKG